MRSTLDELHRDCHLSVDEVYEIDITTDAKLYQRYKDVIPVVIVDGRLTLEGRISEDHPRRALDVSRH